MRKLLTRFFIMIFAISLICIFSACTNNGGDVDAEATIIGIEVDTSTIPDNAVAGSLELSVIKVKIHYSDGTEKPIDLTSDMISINDRNKLEKAGQQQITVVYEKCTSKFQINLSEKPLLKYTLTVEGGIPIAINNVTLLEPPELVDGIFSAQYDAGTVVTVTWVRVEGYEFSYWMDYEVTKDTEITTEIIMNSNHSYKAVKAALVSVVNFVTNGATASTLAPKKTNILYQSDINNGNTLIREDYVFDGWTTTTVSNGSEINCIAEKISFPFKVEIATTLYATWRPLGITYRQQEGQIGFIVTNYELDYLSNITKAPKTLEIPKKYQGYNVTGIDADAFISPEASMLEEIYIPETIIAISDGAFRKCTQLKKISVSASSTKFESIDGVLYNYGLEKLIAYPSAKLDIEYKIGSTVKEIASYAFKNALLGRVSVGSGTVSIGSNAFESAHVDSIDLGSMIINGDSVFGTNLFDINLRKIYVTNAYINYVKGESAFTTFQNVSKIITTNKSDITDVEVGRNLDKTMLYRIVNSENSITPQSSVEIIGAVRNLTTITIVPKLNGRNIFSIGERAFNYCVYLDSIIFPTDSNLERIGKDAFSDTPWLSKTKINDCIIINNILFKYLGNAASFSLPSNITKIAEGAFINNNSLTSLNMTENNKLTFIGAYAFYNCVKLSGNLEFMSNVTMIYNYAFASTRIEKVLLKENSLLTTVGKYAFENCRYLKSVELGAYTTDIEPTSFIYSYSLEKISLQTKEGVIPVFRSYDGILYKCNGAGSAEELFFYPSGKMLSVFDIGEPVAGTKLTIKELGDYSLFFSNIAALKIPSTILSVSTKAIYIPGLIYAEFEKPLSNITYNTMFLNDQLKIGKYEPNYIVFNIEDKIDNVPTVEENTNIDNFYGHDIVLKNSKNNYNQPFTVFMEIDGIIYASDTEGLQAMVATKSLRTVENLTIHSSCREIGKFAFFGNYIIKVICDNSDIFAIHNYAFYGAENLRILDLRSNASIPTVMPNSFNSLFNNGLLVYIGDGRTTGYADGWLLSPKYLLENGEGVANFVTRSNEEWNSITYYEGSSWKTVTVDKYTKKNVLLANFHPIPARKGYIFKGWYDDNGKLIDAKNDYIIPYNIDLTASWEAEVYTIIFKIGAGVTMQKQQMTISYGEAFEYDIPLYPNKIFLYWKDSAGKKYGESPEDETYKIWQTHLSVKTLTLYPVWQDVLYRIIYDIDSLEGATCDTAPKSIKFADNYTLAIPIKTGYVFQGWSLEKPDGSNVPTLITNSGGESLDFWSLNEFLQYTVYPYFIPQSEITVTLIIGKDETDNDIQYDVIANVVFGQKFTFPYLAEKISDGAILLKYPVELFCGWIDSMGVKYTDDDGEGLYSWNVDKNTTLYALWPAIIDSQEEFDNWLESGDLSMSLALNCDISIDRPIGDRNMPYTGTFIGNGHTITMNYEVLDNLSENYDGYVGMIAHNKGTIKNVKLNAIINIHNTSSYVNDLYLGGITGINDGKIKSTSSNPEIEINVSIFVNFTCAGKYAYIGGLAGKNNGIINNVSCEINTITIQVAGVAYDGNNAPKIIAGSIVGDVNDGLINTRGAKYYYANEAFILPDFGSVVPEAEINVNVTKTKIS